MNETLNNLKEIDKQIKAILARMDQELEQLEKGLKSLEAKLS